MATEKPEDREQALAPDVASEERAAPGAARSDAPRADKASAGAIEWIKAVGMPLVTLLVTILGGYFFTSLTKDREARESNERLYAQLLTGREQSDAAIRKDMFGVVINSFLGLGKANESSGDAKPGGSEEVTELDGKVLKIELLANNFSQTLDLAPLFKDLARRLANASQRAVGQADGIERLKVLTKRLDRTAADLIFRQVQSLSRHGLSQSTTESLEALADWNSEVSKKPVIDVTVPRQRLVPSTQYDPVGPEQRMHFSVEVLDVHFDRREVDIRLRAFFPGSGRDDVDRAFSVGPYDFPMLDNTQLPDGLRAAVVMTEFNMPNNPSTANSFVTLHLVVFPAASASFKERQDYDEILLDMLRADSEKRKLR
jgi:hypothetical protein